MKFTLSWLKDHIDLDVDLETLTTRLSAIGLEVEGVDDPAAKLAPFTIAYVVDAKQHPNADRLRVCQVDTGAGIVEVVCGAPNARTGMVGVFAPLGSYIPGTGITLDKRPVRGVVSNGMLVSEREMQISDDHEGIIELEAARQADVGKRYIDVMGLDDPVIEVKPTANRPDCLGVRGIARDLAAAGLGKLKPEPKLVKVEGAFECPVPIEVSFPEGEEHVCPVFAGRYVKGVKNGSSPAWMQSRLKAVGLRPINALVDVTNYVSQDRGRPLHVYDADKLNGTIRARLAKAGERFLALDGKTYTADETMCVIADDKCVLGFGGIIGGEESGCTEETTNVLIECAYFDPIRTAATGRKANVQTDARYRFERGVDPGYIDGGLDLGTHLVLELTGGKPSKARVAGKAPVPNKEISLDFARVEKLTGLAMKDAEIKKILTALGFGVSGKGSPATVTVPSWRPDVHGSADLVEEVIRIAGLDRVPSTPLPRVHGITRAVLTERQRRMRRMKRVLAGRGLVEAVTWSFIPHAHAARFGGGQPELELANPISVEMSSMRPSLLPGLLSAIQRNRHRGFHDLALFEIGQTYRGDKPEAQLLLASGVRSESGRLVGGGRHWSGSPGAVDVFDAKADALAALAAAGFDASKAQVAREAPDWYHPGRSGVLRLGPKVVLAHFGEVHPDVVRMFDVAGPVVAFEVFLDAIPADKKRPTRARPPLELNDLMPVRRDFAFVVDSDVAAADIVRAASGADKGLISSVAVFDLYEGGALGEYRKSVAIEVTLQPKDKTLTDVEIEAIAKKVVGEVKRITGGELRG